MTTFDVDVEIIPAMDGVPPLDSTRLAELVKYALAASVQAGQWSIAIVLTSDDHLRQLHRDFLGIDDVTDVMTFPDGVDPGGEIVISVERAADQGHELGHTTADEVEFLAVHGILHLAGWEDDTPERRARMLARQSALVAAFDAARG
jgi:rRNA maturation RNase YbeY